MIQQKRDNFVAHSLTAKDDVAVIDHLEMEALSLSMLLKVKRQEYDLPEPKAQDVLASFDIRESQVGQQPDFEKAHSKAPKQREVQEVVMMGQTVKSGHVMEIPTKEISEV